MSTPADGPAATSSAPDPERALKEVLNRRGYVLAMHRLLASWDPPFLQAYETLLTASSWTQRTLDRRTKELIYIGVLMTRSTPRDHLAAHMRQATAHGATAREVLEVLELALPPAGVPRFIEAMQVFEDVFGDAPQDL